jgi:hypothetical protein
LTCPILEPTIDYDIGRVAGAALYADDYTGPARMVVDTVRIVIVGMTLVGPSGNCRPDESDCESVKSAPVLHCLLG